LEFAFNVLKRGGYNLEHSFGHGKETLASVLVALNLLAFAFHTAAYLAVLAWQAAVNARGPTYRFFEHLRTITAYVVFQGWDHLLRSIACSATIRVNARDNLDEWIDRASERIFVALDPPGNT